MIKMCWVLTPTHFKNHPKNHPFLNLVVILRVITRFNIISIIMIDIEYCYYNFL